MDTHAIPEGVKVQRFYLTLLGEVCLWCEPLRIIVLEGNGLQYQFRQQYLKVGSTRENYFMHGDHSTLMKNTETLDAYIMHVRQVETLLAYGEPQVLEVFKNTPPMRLYWVLSPIEDLGLAVETVKGILTKEKRDR